MATSTHRTTCNRDCPDACGIVATVTDGRVVKLAGDATHPVTRGFLCWRTNQFLETQYSPQRLKTPLRRRGTGFEPIGWDEALDLCARELSRIKAESGPAAIFHYRSGGSLGLLKTLSDYFFELFGPVTVQRGDICGGAGDAAQALDFGESDSSDVQGVLDSKHVLLWGKNVFTSSPHMIPILKAARARGAKLILIDPVHTRTTSIADQYIQLRPGGDFALAMAVARLLFERRWTDLEAASYCDHLPEFRALSETRSVEQWCALADVAVGAAVAVAEALGPGRPCALLVGWGLGRRSSGGRAVRALDALGAISGNLGVAGGGVSFYFKRRGAFDVSFVRGRSAAPRTICEPTFGPELLAAKDPPVRALWVTAGNPVAMLPESETTVRALSQLDFMVVVDSFLTDTARLATLVLPTTTLLEDDDLLGAYGHHYLSVSRPVVAPPGEVRTDLEIIQGLAARVGLGAELAGTAREWKARIAATKLGPHGIGIDELEAGPVRNPLAKSVLFADRRFPTASGKVNLLRDAPHDAPAAPSDRPLRLMAMSTPRSQSSQWPRVPEGPLDCTLHPDAAPGVADGQLARIESELGSAVVRVRHDRAQRRDVALLPKGGHRALGQCMNSLIRARTTDLGEGGALYDEWVRVVASGGE